ncbi:MAG TPA: cysteine desulfurase family protein [Aggregatilineales bacterium]|nr:cysteine desulfurase family protein [Aggregatilineales bacterium]
MLNNRQIYLDHAATTPVDPRVVEAMLPYFTRDYGNPSSTHALGRMASSAVEKARETIAGILNCTPREIVFTSCGTEGDNLALRGAVMAARQAGKGRYVLTARTEHHAVSHTAALLARFEDITVEWLSVDREGRIAPKKLANALCDNTIIVSVMYANNEIGTIQPMAELAALAHEHGALFHTDAVQAAGQLPLDVKALGVDMLAVSAHKFYGPKGAGFLFVRNGVNLIPSQSGGGQENNLRAGTHNVPLIVGMAKALELAHQEFEARTAHYRHLRDRLIAGVIGNIPGASLTGAPGESRLPNHASFVLEGVESNALLMHLDMAGIAASSGSACNTGSPEPSDVLLTLGYEADVALSSLRLTVGRQTTDADVDRMLEVLPSAVQKVRTVREMQSS